MGWPEWHVVNSLGAAAGLIVSTISLALWRRSIARVGEASARAAHALERDRATDQQWQQLVVQLRQTLAEEQSQRIGQAAVMRGVMQREREFRGATEALAVWARAAGLWMLAVRELLAARGEELPVPPLPPPRPAAEGED